ncbi:MAG TPA: helix-turn-helix transcriptional regulator [Methylomirabilota bacterium]|nr:helix-turn-helix transcriptional regulator [Methylomirabilota bacterium]
MRTQLQEKQQRKIPYRRRLLIACILIFSLLPFGIVWVLSVGHIIDNNLSYLFPVGSTLIGLGLTIYFGLVPASPIETTAPVLSSTFSQEGEGLVPFHEILGRELRKRKMKEEDLAKLMGVSPQEVYKWEKGELEPTNDAGRATLTGG